MAEQRWRKSGGTGLGLGIFFLLGLFVALASTGGTGTVFAHGLAAPAQMTIPPSPPTTDETGALLYLPIVARSQAQPTPTPTATLQPEPTRQWDPRLNQRGAELRPATVTPGQGYWRLVKAVWFDEIESAGLHHIFIDALNADGQRVVGVPVRIYWAAGETTVTTQSKPGEAYAGDFGMFDVAPSYGALPNDGNPADEVWGMGLGSIELPFHTIHTSYGLTWQWTIAGGAAPTATPTPTITPTPSVTPTATPVPSQTATPTPTAITSSTSTPTATPTPAVEWDPRLTQRGASLQEATVAPGNGYWKLVRARWYNEQESESINRQHILVDVENENGQRVAGLQVRIYWNGGDAGITTEAKPGEEYAANFSLGLPAPFYNAAPNDGNPADAVLGMGLGSLENPEGFVRASYGLVWRWTIKSAPTATPTPTASATATITATATVTPTATATQTQTATPTATSTVAGTNTPTPTPTPTAASYLFNRSELVSCAPNAGITYVQGTLRIGGEPVNGYRVAFSFAADGTPVAETISGPHTGYEGWNPGYYSHILQVGSPREGDWWFWVMDGAGQRVSTLGFVHTDGDAGSGQCQQAVIDFHSE